MSGGGGHVGPGLWPIGKRRKFATDQAGIGIESQSSQQLPESAAFFGHGGQ
jgi:hypothetical protein